MEPGVDLGLAAQRAARVRGIALAGRDRFNHEGAVAIPESGSEILDVVHGGIFGARSGTLLAGWHRQHADSAAVGVAPVCAGAGTCTLALAPGHRRHARSIDLSRLRASRAEGGMAEPVAAVAGRRRRAARG